MTHRRDTQPALPLGALSWPVRSVDHTCFAPGRAEQRGKLPLTSPPTGGMAIRVISYDAFLLSTFLAPGKGVGIAAPRGSRSTRNNRSIRCNLSATSASIFPRALSQVFVRWSTYRE